MLFETGAVRQKTPQRNGNATRRHRNSEVDITVHIAIKIEPARVHELHDRDAGEKLRDRSWPHQSRIGGERLSSLDVREAIALSEGQGIPLHHDHDRAGAFALVD